jgi:hypothetical protein
MTSQANRFSTRNLLPTIPRHHRRGHPRKHAALRTQPRSAASHLRGHPRTAARGHHRLAPRPHRPADPGDLHADARQRRPDPDLPGARRRRGHPGPRVPNGYPADVPPRPHRIRAGADDDAAAIADPVPPEARPLLRHRAIRRRRRPRGRRHLAQHPRPAAGGARSHGPASARSTQSVPNSRAHPTVGGPHADRAAAASGSPQPATDPTLDAPTTSEWTRTLLDSGPGWSREVLRHRSSPAGGNDPVPGAVAR